jgi:hypothetical protein
MSTSDHVRIVKRYTVGDTFANQLTVSPRAGRKTKRIVAALVKNNMLLCGADTTVKHEVLDFSKKDLLMAIMSANSGIRQQLGAGGETLLVGFDVYAELNHILSSDPYRVLAFEGAYHRSSDLKIVGLTVKLVPTMSGWLVLPPESSEVYV